VDESSFTSQKQDSWNALSDNVDRLCRMGPSSLSREQLRTFGAQYRAVVSDLALARSQGASDELINYLNELAARAHGALYTSRSAKITGALRFLTTEFPQLVRANVRYVLVAFLIFALGSCVATYAVITDPGARHSYIPEVSDPATASSWIMTNNIRVGVLAFAAGVTFGSLTVYLLFRNGFVLAAVAAAEPPADRFKLFTFVAPHGLIELTAIFICGGAGLMIGAALIAPGNLRRGDAARVAASIALKLFSGTLPMFVIAAIIESFVSPSVLKPWAKFLFSGITLFGLLCYFGFAGSALRKR